MFRFGPGMLPVEGGMMRHCDEKALNFALNRHRIGRTRVLIGCSSYPESVYAKAESFFLTVRGTNGRLVDAQNMLASLLAASLASNLDLVGGRRTEPVMSCGFACPNGSSPSLSFEAGAGDIGEAPLVCEAEGVTGADSGSYGSPVTLTGGWLAAAD